MSNISINHKFHSVIADGSDPTIVQPSNWNDVHTMSTPDGIALNTKGVLTGLDDGTGHLSINGISTNTALQYLRRNAGNTDYEFGPLPPIPPVQPLQLPFLVSSNFIFTPQIPGGSLVIGSNTVAMNPLPPGVIIGDTLYISGGVGTAEVVPVTGLSSSSIIVTCANVHSGAWTIQSATAGIQEAYNSLSSGNGLIYIPVGTWTIYGTIKCGSGSYRIVGAGQGASILTTSYTGGPIISLLNPHNSVLEDFEIDGPSVGNNFAIAIVNSWNSRIQRVKISNVTNGISLTGTLLLNAFRDIEIDLPPSGSAVTGVFINGGGGGEAGGTFDRVFIQYGGTLNGSIGFNIVQGVGALLRDCYTNGVGKGVYINPGSGQTVGIIDFERGYFDGYTTVTQASGVGIHISPATGSQVNSIRGNHVGLAGFSLGLVIDTTVATDIVFTDSLFVANQQDGILVSATVKNLTFNNCWVEGNNGSSNPADGGASISNVTNLTIRGGVFAAGSYGGGSNTQSFGIGVGNCTNVLIDGVVVAPNVTNTITVGSSTNVVIENCPGYNPVGASTITVGASPFTYTSGHSPEIVYISAGTVSSITRSGITIATGTVVGQSVIIPLAPNTPITVTYSVAPNMIRDTT